MYTNITEMYIYTRGKKQKQQKTCQKFKNPKSKMQINKITLKLLISALNKSQHFCYTIETLGR